MALNIGYTCAEFYCYYWFGSLTMLAGELRSS
jgi:Co/Zn/Cd efflux system component